MKVIRRIIANLIDIFVFLAIVVALFMFALPTFFPLADGEDMGLFMAGAGFALVVALTLGVQYPFMKVNQTIGKAFFNLRVESTNPGRPITVGVMIQRELFAKILPMYLLCLPVLFGREGQHDMACETEVV